MFELDDLKLRAYKGWIYTSVPVDEIAANCAIWSRVMKETFPELIHVGGYVKTCKKDFSPFFNSNYHEYLITETGSIIDPTGIQFDWIIGKGNWFYDRCEEHLII